MIGVSAFVAGDVARGASGLWMTLILLMTACLIVWRVVTFPSVTVQSIYGAVSAYMIIGLMFASLYGAMYYLGHRVFFAQATATATPSLFQYFSFTTLTTLGYGDFTAVTNSGRAFAMIEAITGQIFLATLVARLVAAFRPRRDREDDGDRAPGE